MSTKTSAQSVSSGASSTTSATTTTAAKATAKIATTTTTTAGISPTASTSSTAMQAVKIKKELPSDEIKEFAENTMNELLGWYGFDGVDRLDLSAKTSRLLQNAAASANNHAMSQHHMEKRRSRNRAMNFFQMQQNEHIRNIANNNNNNNNNSNTNNNNNRKSAINCHSSRNNSRTESSSRSGAAGSGVSGSAGGGGGLGCGNDSTTSDHDTRSSREDDSKSPHSAGKTTMEEKIDFQNCCWCRRPVPENGPEFLTTTDGPRYCSESCFTQSRRASFKKAKTCDWCKHVRHAVSYVDFQDGASQLQFCSDKCLNQYKMQIFCKETQAHLDMNPHLRDQGMEAAAAGNGAGLITPDLWLRNCRSRSASPASTVSISPGPSAAILPNMSSNMTTSSSSPRITPPHCSANTAAAASSSANVAGCAHKPLISVAPVSKLMSKSAGMLSSSNRQSPKHNRKKRPLRSCVSGGGGGMSSSDLMTSLKHNHGGMSRSELGLNAASAQASILCKSKALLNANASNSLRTSPGHLAAGSASAAAKSNTSTLSQFAGSSVQDLHMSVPPLSPMLEQQPHASHTLPHMSNVAARGATSIPPAFFATPPGAQPQQAAPTLTHAGFPPHPSFLHNAGAAGLLPRFLSAAGGFSGVQQPPPPPPPHLLQPPDMSGLGLGALLGAPPPVTVMVPYPIIIPLPIPIPVPLPVMDFYKAHLTPEERAKLKAEEAQESKCNVNAVQSARPNEQNAAAAESSANEHKTALPTPVEDTVEEPLDFTKSKECTAMQQQADASRRDNELHVTVNDNSLNSSLERAVSEETDPLTPTPVSTPLSEDAVSPAQGKTLHCIVRADDEMTVAACSKHETTTEGGNVPPDELANTTDASDDAKQKLPKFKITRLQTKRTLIQTKETTAECSRPLRKRKRIIDCDFQKIALKDAETEDNADIETTLTTATATATATTACNSNTKATAASSSKKL